MSIKKLDFDSNFFGFGIANLSNKKNQDITKFIKENKIKLVWSLIDTNRQKNINALEKKGFGFVDLKITFSAKSAQMNFKGVRRAKEEDMPALKKIAGGAFVKDSRFNCSKISKKKVREFYSLWVEKAVRGEFDDYCLVAFARKEIAGLVTYRRTRNIATIGLIGVSEEYRSQGIGSRLIAASLDLASRENCTELRVATEGKNIGAQNFYIRNGFKIAKIESWYYKWVS